MIKKEKNAAANAEAVACGQKEEKSLNDAPRNEKK